MRNTARRWCAAVALGALLAQVVAAAPATRHAARRTTPIRHPVPMPVLRPARSDSSADTTSFGSTPPDSARMWGAFYDTALADSVSESHLYMAWGAPWGLPGARSNLELSCRDTNVVDTLYLSFETGRNLPRFYAMMAYLDILPAAGDSLGPFWDFSHDGANKGGLRIQVDPDGTFPCPQPFVRPGMGIPKYDFEPIHGRLFLAYAVRLENPAPVLASTRYCFARLLLDRRRCSLRGAGQPVCIEWERAEYTPSTKGDVTISRGAERFVSVNSPDGKVCAPYRAIGRPHVWLPPPPPVQRIEIKMVPVDSTRH